MRKRGSRQSEQQVQYSNTGADQGLIQQHRGQCLEKSEEDSYEMVEETVMEDHITNVVH